MNNFINKFSEIVKQLSIDIKDDNSWPVIFAELTKGSSLSEQYIQWNTLLEYFLKQEKVIGHCYKGRIYWSLGIIELKDGKLTTAIANLEKSKAEDEIKMNGAKTLTSSIGLLSVVKILLHKFKDRKEQWEFDANVNALYETLNKKEKEQFADLLIEAHVNFSIGKIRYVKPEFFTFITDERTRTITKETYDEVGNSILAGVQNTYYAQIFAIGSIAEALLDELFLRNNQEIWKIFHKQNKADLHQDSFMKKTEYPTRMTLSQKIWVLRQMVKDNICPISKTSVLFLLIIGEYRDLIHPRRRTSFEFDVNRYVATMLFVIVSYIAGDWWPENIKNLIETNYRLNN